MSLIFVSAQITTTCVNCLNVFYVVDTTYIECDGSSFARNSVGLDFARFLRPRIGRQNNIAALPCVYYELRAATIVSALSCSFNTPYYAAWRTYLQHIARTATRLYYIILRTTHHCGPVSCTTSPPNPPNNCDVFSTLFWICDLHFWRQRPQASWWAVDCNCRARKMRNLSQTMSSLLREISKVDILVFVLGRSINL